jgi:hypothetical protein
MGRRTRLMFFGGSRRFAHLLLSRSQAAIHPARRMRESIERRLGGRKREAEEDWGKEKWRWRQPGLFSLGKIGHRH